MEDQEISEKVQDLSDTELAVLLSLVAKQHCIISTEEDTLDLLEEEIKSACQKNHVVPSFQLELTRLIGCFEYLWALRRYSSVQRVYHIRGFQLWDSYHGAFPK